jgi:membrane-associated phospholipid phosphatase
MRRHHLLFWQPSIDYLKWFETFRAGRHLLLFLNYAIWLFFFLISYFLIKLDANIFWQLFTVTLIAEFVERFIKKQIYWRRPLFERKDTVPSGLVKRWYQTGSFPSGHTIKATYFFLFILQYHFFSPPVFLVVSLPLLFFRILVGFHYPIDMLGGVIIGFFLWLFTHQIVAPAAWTQIIHVIFNTIFFIK